MTREPRLVSLLPALPAMPGSKQGPQAAIFTSCRHDDDTDDRLRRAIRLREAAGSGQNTHKWLLDWAHQPKRKAERAGD